MALKTNSTIQSMKKKFDSKKSKINSTKGTTIPKSNGDGSAANKSKHIIFDNDNDDVNEEVKIRTTVSEKPNKADKSRKDAIEIGKQWYLRVCYYYNIAKNSMEHLIVRLSFLQL